MDIRRKIQRDSSSGKIQRPTGGKILRRGCQPPWVRLTFAGWSDKVCETAHASWDYTFSGCAATVNGITFDVQRSSPDTYNNDFAVTGASLQAYIKSGGCTTPFGGPLTITRVCFELVITQSTQGPTDWKLYAGFRTVSSPCKNTLYEWILRSNSLASMEDKVCAKLTTHSPTAITPSGTYLVPITGGTVTIAEYAGP
jgi:hypothetical protein